MIHDPNINRFIVDSDMSVNAAFMIELSLSNTSIASLISKASRANVPPQAMPINVDLCLILNNKDFHVIEFSDIEINITPKTPIAIATDPKKFTYSPNSTDPIIAACIASVLAYAVLTAKFL